MAFFVFARSLVPGLGEMLVAASAAATLNDENSLPRCGQISDDLSRLVVEHESADGNLQNHVRTGMAAAVRAFPVAPPVGLEFAVVTVTQERIVVRIGFEIDAATVASVAARGTAARNVLFATEGHPAITAIAHLHKYFF